MPVKYQTSVLFAALALLLIAPSSHAEWTSSSRPLPFSGVRPASQDDQVKANLRSGAEAMHTGKADEAEHYFREQLRDLRRPRGEFPPWLGDALELLVDNVEAFPPPGDEDSYVVEYIYPH